MSRTIAAVLALSLASTLFAADWPQQAGPNRNNTSSETGLVQELPSDPAKVLWTLETGRGFGGAAIHGGHVFAMDRSGEKNAEQDTLRCLDLKTGKEVWSHTYDAPGFQKDFAGSRTAPAVTEARVYSVGPFGHLLCIDRATQKVLWQTNTISNGGKPGPWAVAVAPLLYRKSVIVNLQNPAAGLAAYDQATGEVLWQAKEVPAVPYASPTLITLAGKQQLVQAVNNGVYAVDPDSGKLLWQYNGWKCNIPIPAVTPISDDGRIFITGGYRAGSAMIQITAAGDSFDVKELWKIPLGSQIHHPIYADGAIYFNGTTNETREGIVCLDPADGKVLWSTKATFPTERGTLLMADGLLYHIDGAGNLRTFKPNREAYTEVSFAKLLDGKDIWAPIALSNGHMVLRDQTKIRCLDLKK